MTTTSTQLSVTRSSCFIHSHGEAEQRFTNRSSEKLKPYSDLYQNWRFLVSLCPPQLPPVQQAAVQPAKSRLVPILPKVLHSLLGCLLRRSWHRYKQRLLQTLLFQSGKLNKLKQKFRVHAHTHTQIIIHTHNQSRSSTLIYVTATFLPNKALLSWMGLDIKMLFAEHWASEPRSQILKAGDLRSIQSAEPGGCWDSGGRKGDKLCSAIRTSKRSCCQTRF